MSSGGGLDTYIRDGGRALIPKPYSEVHCTYNLLSNCSYSPAISRVTVVVEVIFWFITTVTK